jgi:hypothetical protein
MLLDKWLVSGDFSVVRGGCGWLMLISCEDVGAYRAAYPLSFSVCDVSLVKEGCCFSLQAHKQTNKRAQIILNQGENHESRGDSDALSATVVICHLPTEGITRTVRLRKITGTTYYHGWRDSVVFTACNFNARPL